MKKYKLQSLKERIRLRLLRLKDPDWIDLDWIGFDVAIPIDDEIAHIIYRSWQELDADILEPYLADDMKYSSFWVFETLNGKEAYLNYLRGKFLSIQHSKSHVDVFILDGQVVLRQGEQSVYLHLTIAKDKIQSMCMMPYPDPFV